MMTGALLTAFGTILFEVDVSLVLFIEDNFLHLQALDIFRVPKDRWGVEPYIQSFHHRLFLEVLEAPLVLSCSKRLPSDTNTSPQ